jgi:hypothetical protein
LGIEAGRFYPENLNGEAIPIHFLYERSEIGCESTRSVPDLKQIFDTKIFDLLKELSVRERRNIHIEAFLAQRACIRLAEAGRFSPKKFVMERVFFNRKQF